MKLRNKKTGEINYGDLHLDNFESLAELNEEWEDYEEPKEHWCITMYGGITRIKDDEEPIDDLIEIDNYFNSKEDAYDALDKLKAWKRLKEAGYYFTYDSIKEGHKNNIILRLNCKQEKLMKTLTECKSNYRDLKLIFGDENDY